MLERDAEPEAEATDPSPAGKEPVTQGGGESGPVGGRHSPGMGLRESHFENISGSGLVSTWEGENISG